MVKRSGRFLVWQRWGFRLFCCFLAILTSFLTLVLPMVGVAAQSSRQLAPLQTKQPGKSKPDPQVLVMEVVITNKEGKLASEFVDEAYRVIETRPGKQSTKGKLQKDINAIFATGYFSHVKGIPENTPLGVRVTFEVVLNPVLQKVQLEGTTVLPDTVVEDAFKEQYGSVLNLVQLQEGSKKINKWYQDKGYALAQVVDAPKVSPDGIVTLTVAEGTIEKVKVQFLTKDSDQKDAKEIPVLGRVAAAKILDQVRIKIGDTYNEPRFKVDLEHLSILNLAEKVEGEWKRLDDGKIIITIKIINEYTELQRVAKVALDLQDQKNNLGAVNQYQKVLQLARAAHSKTDEAFTLNNIANLYKEDGNYQQAKDFYRQALEIFQELNAHFLEVVTYINLGEANRQLGESEYALDAYNRALQTLNLLGDKPKKSNLFGSLLNGKHLSSIFEKDDFQLYQLLTSVWKIALLFDVPIAYASAGDYQQAFYALNNAYSRLPHSFDNLSTKLSQALDEESRKIYEKYKYAINQTVSLLFESTITSSYSFLYSNMGDIETSLVYTKQAEKTSQELLSVWKRLLSEKDIDKANPYIRLFLNFTTSLLSKQSDAKTIDTWIQQTHELLNLFVNEFKDDEQIRPFIPYIQTSIPLLLNILGESDDDENHIHNLDGILKLLNSFQNSLDKLPDWVKNSYSTVKFITLDSQGSTYFRLGRYRESLLAYTQALELSNSERSSSAPTTLEKVSIISAVGANQPIDFGTFFSLFKSTQDIDRLLAIGKIYEELSDPKSARTIYRQVLNLTNAFEIAQRERSAEAHYGAAKAELLLGSAAKAKSEISAAIEASEYPSSPATLGGRDNQAGFSDAEFKEGYGLELNGKARGSVKSGFKTPKSMPDASTTSKPDPANSCSTSSAYFICKQKYFDFYINLLLNLPQPDDIGAFEASERARTVTAEVFRASDAVQSNQSPENQPKGKLTSSKRRTSGRTRPAHLPEIQALLDDNTLLLEYFLGEKQSHLWAVSKDALKTYPLRERSTIEAKGREFYDLLTAPTGRVRPQTTAKVGKELSAMILGQVADQLGQKRLLIVGDGILQYIPFSALPDPAVTPDSNRDELKGEFAPHMQPLLVNHEVVNLLSASAMVELRQNKSSRPTPTKELAVFADPVFNYEDERVKQTAPALSKHQNLTVLSQPVEPIYTALPGTQQEVKQIAQFVAPDQQSQFLGFDANYETALSDKLKQYRRIHFATHGFFNVKAPEQSGIVLSAIRKNGELQRGSITPAAALNMDLAAADLVVLSGCRTGLSGDLIREGLTGLTGGLMAAGAERVVVSLWSVNDEATEKLMTLFYQNMYKNNSLSPPQALRSAQLSLWQDVSFQTPYNWAAFVTYGEWQ